MTKGPAVQQVVLNDTDKVFFFASTQVQRAFHISGAKQLSVGVVYLAQVNISWAARTVKIGLQRMSLKEPARSTWSYGFLCCMLEGRSFGEAMNVMMALHLFGHIVWQQYTFQTTKAAVWLRTRHLWVTQSPWATHCYCKRSGIDTDQQ